MAIIVPVDANIAAGKHYLGIFDAITPSSTQDGISSMICCRLFRDATNEADTYEGDAGLLEFDLHYIIDTLGSREEYTK